MAVKNYRDLRVWQSAMDLVVMVYEISDKVSLKGNLWSDKSNSTRGGFCAVEYRGRTYARIHE